MKETSTKKPKARDLILFAVLLLIGIGAIAYQQLTKEPGLMVVVHNGDEVYASFPLDTDTEYLIESPYGTNHLVIRDGIACVDEADCANQLCVMQGSISNVGEMIVCLPHEIVVEIREDSTL